MPIINTPSGPIMVDDGATPDVIQKIVAQHSTPAAVKAAAPPPPRLSADQQEVQRRAAEQRKGQGTGIFGNTGANIGRRVAQGFTFNLMDELNGGVHALGKIGQGTDAMAHEYRIARDTQRQLDHEAEQQTGIGGTIGEIAGALANPIADGANALKFAGKAVPLLGKVGSKIANAPALVKAALAGGNQGALNAVGSDESAKNVGDLVSRAGQGFTVGGLTGGVFGGAVTGARRGVQIMADRGEKAAERVASGRIGQMLGKAKMTPAQAEAEIAATNAAGGHAVLADMTPGLQAQAGALAKKPNVPGSNDMIKTSRERLANRNQRFEDEVQNRIKLANGNDAAAHIDNITATRKGQGNIDYQQALDGKFHWDQNLQNFLDKADPEMHDALRQGAKLASLHGQDVGQLGMHVLPDGTVRMQAAPSLRVFDYAKKAMDDKIGAAIKGNNPAYAGGLSNLLNTFKQHIMNAAPDYAPALAKQRDMFQRADATASGLDFVKRLGSSDPLKGPQSIIKELDNMRTTNPAHLEDVRTGMANAILGMSNKADPAQYIGRMSRNPQQRKVMEFIFGGPKELDDFTKWMNREHRTSDTDKLIAPGFQSATHLFKMGDESLGGDAADLATGAFRGFGFGGPTGMAGNVLARLEALKSNLSPHALDAMAKALMSDGKGLAGKVSDAQAFQVARKARNAKWATRVAKAAQQPVTDRTDGEY
jgi:hypothetical protein